MSRIEEATENRREEVEQPKGPGLFILMRTEAGKLCLLHCRLAGTGPGKTGPVFFRFQRSLLHMYLMQINTRMIK